MATLKYSRQRECIRDFVRNCHEHPTADNVYAGIKEEFPNISLGNCIQKSVSPGGAGRDRQDFHWKRT